MLNNLNSRIKDIIIFRIFLFLISIVFSLLCVEGLLRIGGFSYSLYLGKVEFGWPDPVVIEDLYIYDKDLFWVPKNYRVELKEIYNQKPTIIFLGDSCTELGSYPKYLIDAIRNAYPNKKITYSKLGAAGWSSYQGLQLLKKEIVLIKPEILTIFFGWNDHWLGFGVQDKEISSLNPSFLSRFQQFKVIQLIIKTQALRLQKETKIEIMPYRVSPEDFKVNLQKMVHLAREAGIVPILVTAPSAHEEGKEPDYLEDRWLRNSKDLIPLHQQYVSIVRNVAIEEKVILCDLAKEFEMLSKHETLNKYFIEDRIHLTEEGDKKTAGFFYNCFKKNQLLEML